MNDISKIFKSGANFEFKKIDYNDPEVRRLLRETKEKQDKLLRQQIITTEDLRKIVITI